jgi:hypothetical protein
VRFELPLELADASLKDLYVIEQIAYGARHERRKPLQRCGRSTTHLNGSLGKHDSELGHQSTDTVDRGRTFLNEPLAHAMYGQDSLLLVSSFLSRPSKTSLAPHLSKPLAPWH